MLIFFDEIQWMDTPRSGFMMGLEAFWNAWACHRENIMLVVCGSSSSWILNKLVANHGGLYGRLTQQMHLLPLSLGECEKYLQAAGFVMSRYDITQAYMAVGGIPYYLGCFQKELSLSQNINALFFDTDAPLRGEFELLFASLFTNPDTMKSIVEALYEKNRGMTRRELVEKTGIPDGGDLSSFLAELISGGFVMRYCSYGNQREEFYKLIDPFCLFYLRFVKPALRRRSQNWSRIENSQAAVTWRGYAFENVCFNHIKQIKQALGIAGVSSEESLWSKRGDDSGEGTQIDLIIDRSDHIVNMCEIKFYSDEFAVDKEYHFLLIRRAGLLAEHLPRKSSIHSTLITTYGVKRTEYSGDFLHVITMDDLFM